MVHGVAFLGWFFEAAEGNDGFTAGKGRFKKWALIGLTLRSDITDL
jgi:hypothetical protein